VADAEVGPVDGDSVVDPVGVGLIVVEMIGGAVAVWTAPTPPVPPDGSSAAVATVGTDRACTIPKRRTTITAIGKAVERDRFLDVLPVIRFTFVTFDLEWAAVLTPS